MKKLSFFIGFLLISASSMAQMYLWQGGHYISANLDSITFSADPLYAEIVEITPATLSLAPGAESEKLTVKVTPAGNIYAVVWSSSDESVATVKGGYVTGVAEGKATITATVGTAKGTCEVTVTKDATLDNYAIGGWGLFGNPTYIEGTEREIELSNGSTIKCQLGLNDLYVWDNNLVYAGGFSGTGYIAFAQVPVYWIIEGQYAGYFVSNRNGFYIDTIPTGSTYEPYVAEAGQVADLNKYGTYFQQYAAYKKDTTNELDNDLYSEALSGTQLCILYADGDFAQSWYVGNVKYAHLNDLTDATTKAEYYLYDATIEWFDFYSSNRWFGLEASFTEDDNLDKIIEPFDMRTVERHYTNISTTEVSAKPALNTNGAKSGHRTEATKQAPSNWVLGDMNRVHPAIPIIENALRNTKM